VKAILGSLLIGAAGLLLSGCQADVNTRVEVQESGSHVVQYTITAHDELADALRKDPKTDQAILALLTEKTGTVATREDSGSTIVYHVEPVQETWVGDITGIAGAKSSVTSDSIVTMLDVVEPVKLEDALNKAAAGEKDEKAMAMVYRRSTTVSFTIVTPGPVTEVMGLVPGTVDGNTVYLSSSVDTLRPGPVKIVSQTVERDWLKMGGIVLLVVGALYGMFLLVQRLRTRR
jgi:hypothetical protein